MNANTPTEQHKSPLLSTIFRYASHSRQIVEKTETASAVLSQYSPLITQYKYDAKGHISESSMSTCHEDYMYNALGQRTYMLHTRKGIFHYAYDAEGKLTQVNDTRYFYDEFGHLANITNQNVPAQSFTHERVKIGDLDVDRLVKFQNSSGKMYAYSYTPDNPLPAAVYCNGNFVVSYEWDEGNISGQLAVPRLLSCSTLFASWQFGYLEENAGNLPDSVVLTGPSVAHLGYWDLKSLNCTLGYDHLGTVKLVADPYNDLVKELFYDSFGNVFSETEQKIYFPLGFAGGLRDIATGFVCFGFRDYDPSVGRFTTPDPAMDLRGDGDIYDYCVDDPVNFVDADGLKFKIKTRGTNRNPGDARKKNQYQKDKKQREKELEEKEQSDKRNERLQKETSERDVVDPSAEARSDLEETFNAMKDGFGVGSKWGGPFGGAAGAAGAVLGTKAGEEVLDNAWEMDIDISDGTSISGISYSNTRSSGKTTRSHKVSSPNGGGAKGKCTPSTQPRTSDGRFASCGHAK